MLQRKKVGHRENRVTASTEAGTRLTVTPSEASAAGFLLSADAWASAHPDFCFHLVWH